MGNDKKATIYSVFIIADITIYCGFNGMLGLKIVSATKNRINMQI